MARFDKARKDLQASIASKTRGDENDVGCAYIANVARPVASISRDCNSIWLVHNTVSLPCEPTLRKPTLYGVVLEKIFWPTRDYVGSH